MCFDVTVAGKTRRIEIRPNGAGYVVTVDGESHELDARDTGSGGLSLLLGAQSFEAGLEMRDAGYTVFLEGRAYEVSVRPAGAAELVQRVRETGPARLVAPMPGKIVQVLHRIGDRVAVGDGLVVMEAMKMENELKTPREGRVKEIAVNEGQAVEMGALLALVE